MIKKIIQEFRRLDNNHIHSLFHKRLRNQTALSKHFCKLKNMGLSPKIQWKISKRSTTRSCFDG